MTLAFLFVFLCASVGADYQEGLDAYQQGNYDKALGEWLEVTRSPPEQVHPGVLAETYYAIAMLYWTGQGVPQDTATSAKWLQQAAEMHHAGAQTKLGYLCSSGQGVQQSDFEAFKWFQMAAWQGDADAQYNLGVLYREGLGVEVNQTKALEWFREAASNGDAESAKIVAQYEADTPASALPSEPIHDPIPIALVDDPVQVPADAPSRASVLQQEPDTVPEEPGRSPLADDPSRASALQHEPETGKSPLADDPSRASALQQEPETGKSPLADDPSLAEVPSRASALQHEPETGKSPLADDPVQAPADDPSRASALQHESETGKSPLADDPSPTSALQQASWILDRDPEHYTIQVIALRNKSNLLGFTDDHPDWAPWAIYEQSLKGQPLWVLVQGDYANVELARAAAMKFPTDIQKRDQLWIRRFVMVQDLLP